MREEEWVSHKDFLEDEPWMVNKYLRDHKNDLKDTCKMRTLTHSSTIYTRRVTKIVRRLVEIDQHAF